MTTSPGPCSWVPEVVRLSPPPPFRRLILVAAASGLTALVLAGPAAYADAPTQQGWWTSLNPGGLLPIPSPPDVPAHGLLVQGGLSSSAGAADGGATAFAALVYTVPPGSTVTALTLQAAAASTPTSTLELCPLKSSAIAGEQGGPMGDAPSYSCASNSTAKLSALGGRYQFKVSDLVRDGDLAVAVLPTSPLDRVVIDPPASSSLIVEDQSPSSVTTAPAAQQPPGQPGAALSPGAAQAEGSLSVPTPTATGSTSLPGLDSQTVSSAPDSALPSTTGGQGGSPPTMASAPSAAGPSRAPVQGRVAPVPEALNASFGAGHSSPTASKPWLAVLAVAALVVAGAGWVIAGRSAVQAAQDDSSESK